jgi:hypothetical protein
MSKENPIGLAELIQQIKNELLEVTDVTADDTPIFSVDAVELSIQVKVVKEGNAGIKIQVVELGGGLSREDVHTVKVSLNPLLSKDERLQLYKNRFPEKFKQLQDAALTATFKGGDVLAQDDAFGK